ncbi:putative cell division protein WhiA [Eubacterium plexicaudatum ASF492]|uniref:Probable cell division protein WhiA n=1 Tax=Eubacterium plexicaudatum ASF492 TaxID=1235802 RepID=N2ADK4_9FIRM|nr:putative cell division protein WhiA [Eubacterium plexicaudatum ASF492]
MSFSGEVKKELAALEVHAGHCQLAELAAVLSGSGQIYMHAGRMHVTLTTENIHVAERYAKLLQMAGNITVEITQAHSVRQKNKVSYVADLSEEKAVAKLFLLLKIIGKDGHIRENMTLADGLLLQKNCCKRAFLRGAFLAAGSMSNPKKSYHFEMVCTERQKAVQLQELFGAFQLEAKLTARKNHEIVYLKEGSQIVDALNIMGAHVALMDLENVRIIKEMRNDINRRVNCEAANINKTVNAAYRQQEAIRFLEKQKILQGLPKQLQEIAALRLENPEATIRELSGLCCPPVGKSGVNHRLRRLEEIAEQMGYEKRNDQS